MFPMAAQAEQFGDDELRTFPRPRLGNGMADNFQTRGQIGAINRMRLDSVANGFVGEIIAGELR